MSLPSLLLHCCCAPCTTSVMEILLPDYKITLLFYNPNIEPFDEYGKRAAEMKKISNGLDLIISDYNEADFEAIAAKYPDEPEGGERCKACFELRLKKTAQFAFENGFEYFTTTLSVSPHKNAVLLNDIGKKLSNECKENRVRFGTQFLCADFKKRDGYKRSIELSKRSGIYRQIYCGCRHSKRN